ncbi:MAG: class I SAM-dependent rRNA methyltransferase, partial [Bacteroidota bacterium]|nr:class I SAM-dependent rRNA methyltransferase [Bacteroidota bacterium]
MPAERSRVILSSGKDQSLRRFHPWVFSGAIKKIKGPVQEGDVVDVYSNQDEYLGTGHIQDGSIAIRIFSFEQIDPKIDFWKAKIQKAYDYRKNIGVAGNKDTNVFRLVYAEGDGM